MGGGDTLEEDMEVGDLLKILGTHLAVGDPFGEGGGRLQDMSKTLGVLLQLLGTLWMRIRRTQRSGHLLKILGTPWRTPWWLLGDPLDRGEGDKKVRRAVSDLGGTSMGTFRRTLWTWGAFLGTL